jgi:predicted metalloenzyme YecM
MQNPQPFLDSFFTQIHKVGLDISGLSLDHIAYQTSSAEDYEKWKHEFSTLGQEINEEIIGGRRVTVFKLHEPINYKSYRIQALELIEPRAGQKCESAFQHAEFVLEESFEDYMALYPEIAWDTSSMNRDEFAHLKLNFENGLTLKFLHHPILELVAAK